MKYPKCDFKCFNQCNPSQIASGFIGSTCSMGKIFRTKCVINAIMQQFPHFYRWRTAFRHDNAGRHARLASGDCCGT